MCWCCFGLYESINSLPCVPAGTLQQLISDTMVRWAQESVIEDPELVRAMFVLLHRQYDGIGGQVGPVHHTVPVKLMINLYGRGDDFIDPT